MIFRLVLGSDFGSGENIDEGHFRLVAMFASSRAKSSLGKGTTFFTGSFSPFVKIPWCRSPSPPWWDRGTHTTDQWFLPRKGGVYLTLENFYLRYRIRWSGTIFTTTPPPVESGEGVILPKGIFDGGLSCSRESLRGVIQPWGSCTEE